MSALTVYVASCFYSSLLRNMKKRDGCFASTRQTLKHVNFSRHYTQNAIISSLGKIRYLNVSPNHSNIP